MPAPTAEDILHIEVLAKLESIQDCISKLREGEITSERLKQTLLEVASSYLHATQAFAASKAAKSVAA